MAVLPDWMIERDVKIEPFSPQQKRPGVISYGVTSYGYDVRCGYVFKVFSPIHAREIDPKNFDPKMLVEVDLTGRTHDNYILIPPHSFVLAESLETFRIPRDVLCIVVGKSTYARCGLIVNVTPGEPEWEGKWTIELSNTTPLPIRVYAGEGIMQCVFIRSDGDTANVREVLRTVCADLKIGKVARTGEQLEKLLTIIERPEDKNGTCRTSYLDKKGKYQDQTGLTLPKVDSAPDQSKVTDFHQKIAEGTLAGSPKSPFVCAKPNDYSFYRPTKALILHKRTTNPTVGCCDRYANNQSCTCYKDAADFCSVCNDPLCDNAGGKH